MHDYFDSDKVSDAVGKIEDLAKSVNEQCGVGMSEETAEEIIDKECAEADVFNGLSEEESLASVLIAAFSLFGTFDDTKNDEAT